MRVPKCNELLRAATDNPAGLRFEQVCQLAECFGFIHAGGKGSHRIYKRPGHMQLMNFQQGNNGKAVPYQVRQLLAVINELNNNDA